MWRDWWNGLLNSPAQNGVWVNGDEIDLICATNLIVQASGPTIDQTLLRSARRKVTGIALNHNSGIPDSRSLEIARWRS